MSILGRSHRYLTICNPISMTSSICLAIVKHPNISFEIKVVGLYGVA